MPPAPPVGVQDRPQSRVPVHKSRAEQGIQQGLGLRASEEGERVTTGAQGRDGSAAGQLDVGSQKSRLELPPQGGIGLKKAGLSSKFRAFHAFIPPGSVFRASAWQPTTSAACRKISSFCPSSAYSPAGGGSELVIGQIHVIQTVTVL